MDQMIDFGNSLIPDYTKTSLENYLLYGLPPGGFLTAVLTNNLFAAIHSADHQNLIHIADIVMWLSTLAPICSYGSHENIKEWMSDKDGYRKRYADKIEKDYVWRSLKKVG